VTRFCSTALLVLGATWACLCAPTVSAQQFHESLPPSATAVKPESAHWTPLVARFVERDHAWTQHGLPETLEFSGVYYRDRSGSWYRRMQVASRLNLLRIVSGTDSALLYDRPNHTMYTLDFARGTVQKQLVDAKALPDFAASPMSREVFEADHAEDKFLGRKRLGGLDCEGYALRDERRKNKYVAEMWYAPSLAYLAVSAKTHFNGDQDIITTLEDIQPGKDPDPQFFTLPVDLKLIK
jgi:hypothetical protein